MHVLFQFLKIKTCIKTDSYFFLLFRAKFNYLCCSTSTLVTTDFFVIMVWVRATQQILTKVLEDKLNTSRGPAKFLTGNDENKTISMSKYKKILGFY